MKVVKEETDELIIEVDPPSKTSVILGKKELQMIEHPEGSGSILMQASVRVTNAAGSIETETANITMLARSKF